MFRPGSAVIAAFVVSLLTVTCAAQGVSNNRGTSCSILVKVVFENEGAAGQSIRVKLTTEAGVPVADQFTDEEGRVTFRVTFPDQFRVEVSGTPIVGTTTVTFRVEDQDKSKTIFVKVKPKVEEMAATSRPASPNITSAADLRVPSDARKVFHKGMVAWEQHDYAKAAEQFEKAVAIYPEYDTAFNNLGVMYTQMNQVEKARAAFERSVALNDKNADADRNLARILLRDGNDRRAAELLKKSLVVEPLNPITLTLLCVADIQAGDNDGALQSARKVHQLPHEGYSLVHYIAGQAYEHKGELQNAYVEYQTYLQETPAGPEAQQVRAALAHLTPSNEPKSQ